MIITGGENVFSPEVENAISAIDNVVGCAVVSLTSGGERPSAQSW